MNVFAVISLTFLCFSVTFGSDEDHFSQPVPEWQRVEFFNLESMVGPPRPHFPTTRVYGLVNEYKTGEDVFFNSTAAKFDSKACFLFDFHMNVRPDHGLKLFHIKASGSKLVWQRFGFHEDLWKSHGVFVDIKTGDKLIFVANTVGGSISLTNMKFDMSMGFAECQFGYANTDFEADEIDWKVNVIPAEQAFQFAYDHSSLSPKGRVGSLVTGKVTHEHPLPSLVKCFTFWFYRPFNKYKKPTEFTLELNGEKVFQTLDEIHRTDEWIQGQISLNLIPSKSNHLEFIANATTSSVRDGVLFDDFRFHSLPCEEPVSCEFFHGGICGWNFGLNLRERPHQRFWRLGLGRVEDVLPYQKQTVPIQPRPHIYVDLTSRAGETITISSDFLPNKGDYCAQVAVLHHQLRPDDKFEILSLVESLDYSQVDQRLTMNAQKASEVDQGFYVEDNIELTLPANLRPRRIVLSMSSKHQTSRIGVKSVKVREGKCHEAGKPTDEPFVKSKLDKSTLIIADELMKNSRTGVSRLLDMIKIEDPIKVITEKVLHELNVAVELIEKNLK